MQILKSLPCCFLQVFLPAQPLAGAVGIPSRAKKELEPAIPLSLNENSSPGGPCLPPALPDAEANPVQARRGDLNKRCQRSVLHREAEFSAS